MSSPPSTPRRLRLLVTAALVTTALTLALQFVVVSSLRRENASLRAQVKRLRGLEADSLELQRLRTHLAEPERMRRNILELHRLRKEVESLRAGQRAPDGDAIATGPVSTNAPAAPPTEATTVSPALLEATKTDWVYRGFDTPVATLETILWAGRENRVDVFLDSFVPAIQQEFDAAMAESGEVPVLDAEDGPIAQATGLRVLAVVEKGANEVELRYSVGGWREGRPFRQALRRTDSGWKFSGDPEDLD